MRRHLLVTNDFPPKVGGIQSYLWELWRRLDPASFTVLTASSHPDAPWFDADRAAEGMHIERVPQRILYFPTPSVRRQVRAAAARWGASLVLFDPVLPLGLLGPSLGLPYGVILHGAEAVVPARLPATRAALVRVLEHASVVVSAGSYPGDEAARALATARRRRARMARDAGRGTTGTPVLVEVPPGVDCDALVPLGEAERLAARRRLALPEGASVVASVSRLVPRKGMDVLVEAAALLRSSHPRLLVVIAGTGREESRLAAQVRQSGAPVRLLGAVPEDDKAALLGCADVFAMACRSRWGGLEQEGFGIVFLEAAAAGVPQVAGASGGAAEAVADGTTGIVVGRPRRAEDVAAAIARLVDDDELRRSMGRAARQRACSTFDYGVLAPKLAAALAEVQG